MSNQEKKIKTTYEINPEFLLDIVVEILYRNESGCERMIEEDPLIEMIFKQYPDIIIKVNDKEIKHIGDTFFVEFNENGCRKTLKKILSHLHTDTLIKLYSTYFNNNARCEYKEFAKFIFDFSSFETQIRMLIYNNDCDSFTALVNRNPYIVFNCVKSLIDYKNDDISE